MATKMGKRLMGICGLAVTAVYTAGYIYTQTPAQASASSLPTLASSAAKPGANVPPVHSVHKSASTHTKTATKKSTKKTTAKSVKKPTKKFTTKSTKKPAAHATTKVASAHVAQYKDGTFTGTGSNPYGGLSLDVTIAHGKIASVNITQYTMHYPQSVIDPQLPQEAVSMQTWKIYLVSGATASTYNFAEAMYQALQKAKA